MSEGSGPCLEKSAQKDQTLEKLIRLASERSVLLSLQSRYLDSLRNFY